MINPQRLADTFTSLVAIDSVSGEERAVCEQIQQWLVPLGCEVSVDDAATRVGGNCGNLLARVPGNRPVAPILFNAHMDTVEPGRGIRPQLRDGVFTSTGDTILGADDKSAVAILIEALRVIHEEDLPHGPIELLFTVCEEVGLKGAKALDVSRLNARFGYALDTGDIETLVTRAPGARRIRAEIFGKDAHAGVAPERGINAIQVASRAIADLTLGRLDDETTCNIGVISGGKAMNIVPDRVSVIGEVRSHDPGKLERETNRIVAGFERAVAEYVPRDREADLPRAEILVEEEFSPTRLPEDHPVVRLALRAAENLGRRLRLTTTGGGADANVFFAKKLMAGVLGTGMRDMHTVRESVALEDMRRTVELVLEIVRLHAAGESDRDAGRVDKVQVSG